MKRFGRIIQSLMMILNCFGSPTLFADDHPITKEEARQKLQLQQYYLEPAGKESIPTAAFSIQLYNEAVEHFRKREYDLALNLLEESVRQDAQNSYAYALMGEIYYLKQNMKDAKASYQIAFSLRPTADLKSRLEQIGNEAHMERGLATYTEEHFIIKYHDQPGRVEGYELREMLRYAYRDISQVFSFYLKHQIVVLLYDEDEFNKGVKKPQWAMGIYDGKVRMPLRKGHWVDHELKKLAYHEVTHAFVSMMSAQKAPLWIDEGLAVFVASQIVKEDLTVLKAALKTQSLIPIESLMNTSDLNKLQDPLRIALFYQQSYHIVSYLVSRFHMFCVKEMLKYYAEGLDSESVFQNVIKMSSQRFEQEWKTTLSSQPL